MNKAKICLIIFFSLFTSTLYAWDHSIELGLGYSHDPNDIHYNNYGIFLSGDIYPIYRGSRIFWSIGGALGQWHTTAPSYQNLTTGALSLNLRLYPTLVNNLYPFYFYGSAGPALLSNRHFGVNTQAGNLTIQTLVGLGIEFDCIDTNLRFVHFSNAGLGKPNEGFNILYVFSVGYLFD